MAGTTDVILGSCFIIGTTSVVRVMKENSLLAKTGGSVPPFVAPSIAQKSRMKPVVFAFGLTVALLGVAIVAPTVAKILAYLGLVGAFAVNGPVLFSMIGKLGS